VERLLRTGKAVVFFDGLDELVDTRRRRGVSQLVENFCTNYPLTCVLVTSRRVGYDQAKLAESVFSVYRLAPFSDDQAAEYAMKWFRNGRRLHGDEDPQRWADAFMEESSNVPELRSNPLMLALMCILYRGEGSLPRNRPAVYERCATLLFETWDASRRIHVDLRAATSVEQMLRHLAYWLLTRPDAEPSVTEAELVERVTGYLHGRRFDHPDDAASAAREFVAFCRGRAWVFTEVGSDAQGDALFTFTHRTFMEYFAAAYLASTSDTPEELCHKGGWFELSMSRPRPCAT
jgi:predicted NACHT family NTPase